ncbi:MAG: pantoate--beta-alanine ligase, partial [Bdellovibrionota bacterium]
EDLARYPRTLSADLVIASQQGCTVAYVPSVAEIYPSDNSTFVEETSISKPLCGEFRPGHFRGVTTVVLKLLNQVQPHAAYFGLKDAQQFFVVQQMVRDLDVPVEIVGVPTVREASGLALSSRNSYLSDRERAIAPRLWSILQQTATGLKAKENSATEIELVLNSAKSALTDCGFRVQYFELREARTLNPVLRISPHGNYVLAASAYLGQTRLIDNIIF